MAPITLIHEIWQSLSLKIDLALLVGFGVIHIATWLKTQTKAIDPGNKAGEGLRAAASGGLTVVGILLPASFLVVQLVSTKTNRPIPNAAVAALTLAFVWLLCSLVCGAYVLFVAVTKAYDTSPLSRRDIGIAFGLQLILLVIGVIQVVWGFWLVAGSLLT